VKEKLPQISLMYNTLLWLSHTIIYIPCNRNSEMPVFSTNCKKQKFLRILSCISLTIPKYLIKPKVILIFAALSFLLYFTHKKFVQYFLSYIPYKKKMTFHLTRGFTRTHPIICISSEKCVVR